MKEKNKEKMFWSQRRNCYVLVSDGFDVLLGKINAIMARISYSERADKWMVSFPWYVNRVDQTTVRAVADKLEELNNGR